MKGILTLFVAATVALVALSAAAQEAPPAAPKPPAQYQASGSFIGGVLTERVLISGIRFGGYDDYTRVVLDLDEVSASGLRQGATAHPVYEVTYHEFPYRLVIRLTGVSFDEDAHVQTEDALPFSIAVNEAGLVREMQLFLPGPCEFKVIEIDDPAKLSIDVRPTGAQPPTIYTVQLTAPANASEAYALLEQGPFPEGFAPHVLLLGKQVVVEAVYLDARLAAEADTALQNMGYATVINERRGDELPQA